MIMRSSTSHAPPLVVALRKSADIRLWEYALNLGVTWRFDGVLKGMLCSRDLWWRRRTVNEACTQSSADFTVRVSRDR